MSKANSSSTSPFPTDPFFFECLREAAQYPGFVEEYDRLTGSNLSRRGTGLDLAIDQASGRLETELHAFAIFVRDHVYVHCRAEARDKEPSNDE